MRFLACLLTLSLCHVLGINSEAGSRGRRHQAEAGSFSMPAEAVIDPTGPPSANLTRFMQVHVALLSDITPAGKPASIIYRMDLLFLRTAFQTQSATAPPEQKAAYVAALKACDIFAAAIEERDRAAAIYASAQNGASPQDVQDVRTSAVRAQNGYGNATPSNNAKETAANSRPDPNQSFMDSAALTAWTARASQLRQQIDAAYAQEIALEQSVPASPATPTPSPEER
jgi:hypothetical protein